jgi:hypothetical protein
VRLGLLAVVGVAILSVPSVLSEYRLRSAVARLDRDDPGWRIEEIEAARDAVADGENSARVVVATQALLPSDSTSPGGDLADGLAAWPVNERLRPEDYGRLCNSLGEWDAALTGARKLADLPNGRHRLVYKKPYAISLVTTHLDACRQVTKLLRLETVRRADEGDPDGALVDCRAMVNAGRSIGDEPLGISQLWRMACVEFACGTLERVLAQGEPSPAELLPMQRLLETEDAFPDYWHIARGERAGYHDTMTHIESGDLPLKHFTGLNTRPGADLLQRLWKPSFKTDHANNLPFLTRFVEVTRLPLHEQAAAEAALNAEITSIRRSSSVPNLAPALGQQGERGRRKHAYLRSAIVCLAAERHRRQHGAWPAAAADLVPNELSAVPADPYDGQPIRLHPVADGIVVYSVGPDMVDDGGKPSPGKPWKVSGKDCGYRLWDPDRRGRPPTGGANR